MTGSPNHGGKGSQHTHTSYNKNKVVNKKQRECFLCDNVFKPSPKPFQPHKAKHTAHTTHHTRNHTTQHNSTTTSKSALTSPPRTTAAHTTALAHIALPAQTKRWDDDTHNMYHALRTTWNQLDTVLDSGCTRHTFARVTNKTPCSVKLHGIGSTTNITHTGTVDSLHQVLENPSTPINLVSLGMILQHGPWSRIEFAVTSPNGDRVNQLVWGYTAPTSTTRTLLAYKNRTTNGLFRCTKNITAQPENITSSPINNRHESSSASYTAEALAYSSLDIHERDPLLRVATILGYPSVEMLRNIFSGPLNKIFKLTKAMVKRYATLPNEARLYGGMMKPIYTGKTNSKKTRKTRTCDKNNVGNTVDAQDQHDQQQHDDVTPQELDTTPGIVDTNMQYMTELQADSKQLRYKGKNGETHSFDIIDRHTGTRFGILHKGFATLAPLVEKKLIQIKDDALRRQLMPNPKFVRIRLDGHQSQISKHASTITDLQKRLISLDHIAINPVAPGLSRQMGRIGNSQRYKNLVADALFHERGSGLPKWCWSKALDATPHIMDFYPQTSKDGKSSFEIREGKHYTLSDLPVPLFSTAYLKNLAEVGTKNKQGYSEVGVLIGYRPNINSHEIWIPRTNEIVVRAGCIFNSRFSTFKKTRIADMRAGRQVHAIHDTTTERHTRSRTKTHNALRLEPVYHQGIIQYYIAKLNGEELEKPYCCPDDECTNHKALNGFKSLAGLKMHMAAKRKRKAAQAKKEQVTPPPLHGGATTGSADHTIGNTPSSGGATTGPSTNKGREQEIPSTTQQEISSTTPVTQNSQQTNSNAKHIDTELNTKQQRTAARKRANKRTKANITQPLRKSTRNKIKAKALAQGITPFIGAHSAIYDIAQNAIAEHAYMTKHGSQNSGLVSYNVPTKSTCTGTHIEEEDDSSTIQQRYDQRNKMYKRITTVSNTNKTAHHNGILTHHM